MFLHMDGARISNAVAAQKISLRQATRDLGVDVLSFGGTKNGLMGVDAVVFSTGTGRGFFIFAEAGYATGLQDALFVGADGSSSKQ